MADSATLVDAQAPGHERVRAPRASLSVLRDPIAIMATLVAVIACVVRPALQAALAGEAPGLAARWDALELARLTAVSQWGSFAGIVLVLAMLHARLSAKGVFATSQRANLALGLVYTLVMCAGYLAFVWTPTSVITLMLHDSFIFVDSSYRILGGQTPNTDFSTPLGPAVLYLPALGVVFSGGFGGSVEMASVFVAAALCAATAYVASSRIPAFATVLLLLVVFLVTVPATLLEGWGAPSSTLINDEPFTLNDGLTWAMFYNRWGWAALIPLFLILTPRRDGLAPRIAEIFVYAATLVFLYNLKLSYFAIAALGAVLYAVLNDRPWRTLWLGAAATVSGILVFGLMTGTLVGYLRDVLEAAGVSGGRVYNLGPIVRTNVQQLLLAVAPIAVLAYLNRGNLRDLWVTLFILLGSLFIINQNAQTGNIITLVVLGAYGLARLWASEERIARLVALSSFAMLAAPTILNGAFTMMDQTVSARREEMRGPAPWTDTPAMKGMYLPERESFLSWLTSGRSGEDLVQSLPVIGSVGRRMELRTGELMETLLIGMKELAPVLKPGDSVAMLEMSNPFPALLGVRSPKGMRLTMHEGRTISADQRPDPAVLFADTDHVMIARVPMMSKTAITLEQMYDDWLQLNYQEKSVTTYWVRYSRRRS